MNKSFISTFITALLALANAELDTSERILRRGGGDKLAKLQNMIDTKCTAAFSLSCPDDTPSDEECTFENPERPDITGLSQEEIQQLKEDYRATRKERKQQLLMCACCGGFSLDEMLPFAQGSDGTVSSTGSGRPGMFGGGSRPEGAEGSGFQGGGGQSGGRPGRGGGLRDRQPVETEAEVDVSGGEESISSIDEEGDTSGDESTSADP